MNLSHRTLNSPIAQSPMWKVPYLRTATEVGDSKQTTIATKLMADTQIQFDQSAGDLSRLLLKSAEISNETLTREGQTIELFLQKKSYTITCDSLSILTTRGTKSYEITMVTPRKSLAHIIVLLLSADTAPFALKALELVPNLLFVPNGYEDLLLRLVVVVDTHWYTPEISKIFGTHPALIDHIVANQKLGTPIANVFLKQSATAGLWKFIQSRIDQSLNRIASVIDRVKKTVPISSWSAPSKNWIFRGVIDILTKPIPGTSFKK